ncbi:MAG: hypothetical protein J0I77_12430 [Rudaea sp.]|uniref:hypothetical protein n=1 Tax=unclassified Rudaea TaxID=2627037 RepID=UPI0010F4676F|nr:MULTISPECIES: hypothetical protein [unclassified Rudaea]MBN8886521.1 hypothetical protein [Rudaea sp.]MBR0344459.1 hypothetical protein [Rudaea sp.]
MNTTSLRAISLGADDDGGRRPSAWRTVLGAGAAAATLDLIYACGLYYLLRGAMPDRVLHTIASGIYGQEAYTGGLATAAVGFVAHYVILVVAAWWFFLASRNLRVLRERAVACGLLYGFAIYCTMNFLVVPLSNSPLAKHAYELTLSLARASDIGMHLIFGLIIAFATRSYWRRAQ